MSEPAKGPSPLGELATAMTGALAAAWEAVTNVSGAEAATSHYFPPLAEADIHCTAAAAAWSAETFEHSRFAGALAFP